VRLLAGPEADTSVGPMGHETASPTQEAAEEMNRILRALHIVEEFFQVEDLGSVIPQEEQQEMLRLLMELHVLRAELRELLNDKNPPPGRIGQLVEEIHELQQEVASIRRAWGESIVEIIASEGNTDRLRLYYRFVRFLPAFHQVGLFPPPPPPELP
jgi:hypothetical protein